MCRSFDFFSSNLTAYCISKICANIVEGVTCNDEDDGGDHAPRGAEAPAGEHPQVPLTAFDSTSLDGYTPSVFAWNELAPDNAALVDGLLAAVARYPHLAGRLGVDDRGRKCFHLNDVRVLVVEATTDADLADALAHNDAAHINKLYPRNVQTSRCSRRSSRGTGAAAW